MYALEVRTAPGDGVGRVIKQGTAWFLRPDLIVTAFHVVGVRNVGWLHQSGPHDYRLRPDDQKLLPLCADHEADIALLECAAPPAGVATLSLTDRLAIRARWEAKGFPKAREGKEFVLSGEITAATQGDLTDTALQLLVDQTSDAAWEGMSGSAVRVGDLVGGVLTSDLPRANTIYAASVAAVRRLLAVHDAAQELERECLGSQQPETRRQLRELFVRRVGIMPAASSTESTEALQLDARRLEMALKALREHLHNLPRLIIDNAANAVATAERAESYVIASPTSAPAAGVWPPIVYVDRPELTQPLLSYLLDAQGAVGRAIISALHGLGGIGKTTIARWVVTRPEIAQRFRDGRIWVTLGNEPPDAATIISDWIKQLDRTIETMARVEAARGVLESLLQDRAVLFVIDDVWRGRSAQVAQALLVPSPHSRFLLTTRFPRLADDLEISAENFALDEMNIEQARELIMRALGEEPEESLADRLCEAVGGHPLALELAAARIRGGLSWNTVLTDLTAEIARLEVLEKPDDALMEPSIVDRARDKRLFADSCG